MKKILSFVLLAAMLVTMIVVNVSAAAWDGTSASEALEGEGTQAKPYLVKTAADLAFLAKSVDAGTTYEGKYITQTADIDLGNKEWEPIGASGKPFAGVYDGKGFKIENMLITKLVDGVGLFGQIQSKGTGSAGIANVNLSGKVHFAKVDKETRIAGLAGYIHKNSSEELANYVKIINTVVDVDIIIDDHAHQPRVGGFAGYSYCVDFINCVNKGDITALKVNAAARIGGFVGQCNRDTFTDCVNEGNITVEGTATNGNVSGAGFIGMLTNYQSDPAKKVVLKNCVNKGNVTITSVANADKKLAVLGGGFAANSYEYPKEGITTDILNCYNAGKITVTAPAAGADGSVVYAGGIVAYTKYKTLKIDGCVNSAEVKATGFNAAAGGIMAAVTNKDDTTVVVTNNQTVGKALANANGCTATGNTEDLTAAVAGDSGKLIVNAIKPSKLEIGGFKTGYVEPETTAPETKPATPGTTEPTTPPTTGDAVISVAVVALVAILGVAYVSKKSK